MKGIFSIILMASALSATSIHNNIVRHHESFLPPNDMKIPVGDKSHVGIRGGQGVTEAEYNKIMDHIEALYGSVVQQKGGTLVVNRLWSDSTVNSSAEQQGNQWIINMFGGIARHPDNTYEGEALIACHEMGHHLGGAPKINSMFGGTWASNEGEADYFATLKCLRLMFADDDNAAIVAHTNIDPLVKSRCLAQFTSQREQDLCMRISLSAEAVSYIFQDLKKDASRPKFSTPDPSQVSRTDDDHPATQCRMDTYFQGSLCTAAINIENGATDFKVGACVEGVDGLGFRPRCWFNPDSSNGGGGGSDGSCPIGDPQLCDQLCKINPTYCKH